MRFTLTKSIKLSPFFRKEFSKPFGLILKGNAIKRRIGKGRRIYAIGDITVATLLELGYVPRLSVFDYRSERRTRIIPAIRDTYKNPVVVRNKRGTLSIKLWNAVGKASGERASVGIKVIGEEDLASLACIFFASDGDLVMYGLRGKGMVMIKVNSKIRNYIIKALEAMLDA